jgi:hypothetical protein
MEMAAMTLQGDALKDAIGQTRAKWGWFVGLGVLLLILGGIAFGNLFIATVASVYVVGWLMLMAGIIEIMHAFGVKTWSRFFYWLLSGLLYAVAWPRRCSPSCWRSPFSLQGCSGPGSGTSTDRTKAGAGLLRPASSARWQA